MKKYKPIEETASTHDVYKHDFQTPIPVARYMVSLLPDWAQDVLEPTPGIGNIRNEIIKSGRMVTAPDNYFDLDPKEKFQAVVMNPPFAHKFTNMEGAPITVAKAGMRMGYWFLTDCMRRSDHVVALMPWFTISDSDVRMRALKRWGIRSITALPRKTFQFARIQTMVIYLEHGFKGETGFYAYDCLEDHRKNPIPYVELLRS